MEETLSFHVQKPGLMGCLFLKGSIQRGSVHPMTTNWQPILHQNNTTRSQLSSLNGLGFSRMPGFSPIGWLTEVFQLKN